MDERIEITLEIEGEEYLIDFLAFMKFCPIDSEKKTELAKGVAEGVRYFIIPKPKKGGRK